jgi:hypothetical protein
MKIALASLAWLAFASIASAQSSEATREPPNVKTELVRISLGAGLSVVGGPDVDVDGEPIEEEGPVSLPMPSIVARVELVLSELVLIGVQSSVFGWQGPTPDTFGDDWHYTIDASALLRLRWSLGSYKRNEILASIQLGPSFDNHEMGPRDYGADATHHVGWHTGLLAGYVYSPVRNPIGFFLEAGMIYHRLTTSLEYENATVEITNQPVEALIRGGMMIPFR